MKYFYILILLFLTACSSVGWGKDYEITKSNAEQIHIKYDRMLVGRDKIDLIANQHCHLYNKKSVAAGLRTGSESGLLLTQHYKCAKIYK